MNIAQKFKELKKKNEKALIAYVAGGDPDYESSKEIIKAIAEAGADIIEIGVPFSDPMADGPVIQLASERALKSGISMKKLIKMVKELRNEGVENIPFLFMSYYNPIYAYGISEFVKDVKKAGLNGVIIPDLPPDEADEFLVVANEYGLDTVFLLAPTMNDERMEIVTKKSSGFVYFVSVAGVTGARTKVNEKLPELIKKVKDNTDIPVGVGFGISTREQIEEITEYADACIVGSAIVKVIEKNLQKKESMLKELKEFIVDLKAGTVK